MGSYRLIVTNLSASAWKRPSRFVRLETKPRFPRSTWSPLSNALPSTVGTDARTGEALVLKSQFNKVSSDSDLYCLNSQHMYTQK